MDTHRNLTFLFNPSHEIGIASFDDGWYAREDSRGKMERKVGGGIFAIPIPSSTSSPSFLSCSTFIRLVGRVTARPRTEVRVTKGRSRPSLRVSREFGSWSRSTSTQLAGNKDIFREV